MILKCLLIFLFSLIVYCFEEYNGRKKHIVSSTILCLLVYIMVAGNYQNADTYASEISYTANRAQTTFDLLGQWAYYLVINICNMMHMTFEQYRFVVYGIGYIALIKAIRRVNANLYQVLLLYAIFPMIIDATQMKNFVAMCFITLALTNLVDGTKKGKIWYVVWIIIAAGFHVVSFVYLPLVFLCDSKYSRRVKLISVLPVILFALVFSNRSMSGYLSGFLLSHMNEGLSYRASSFLLSRVNNGYLVYFLATFIVIFMVYTVRKKITENYNSNEEKKSLSKVAFYCAIFSLAFLPFYFLRQDFSRLLRNLFPMIHILLIRYCNMKKSEDTEQRGGLVVRINRAEITIIAGYLLLLAYMFFWDIYGYKDSVLLPFFEYNSILR